MIRDYALSMGDQCNNPGSMYPGRFGRRFLSREHYTAENGHKCAIFKTPAHGAATLIELILNRKGLTVHEYINGGDTLPKHKSYSGGADYVANGYMKSMRRRGIYGNQIIEQDDKLLIKLVNAHSYSEGNNFELTARYFKTVQKILKARSKVYR